MKKCINIKTFKKIIMLLAIIGIGIFSIDFIFCSPTKINAYVAAKLYSQPANSYFDDDNFYQCVVDAYNSKNGTSVAYSKELTDNELQTIETLRCNNKGIVSTKGLEKMNSLTYIDLSKNELTQLNIQKNKKLVYLFIYSNQLVDIDISENINLESLRVSNNYITELNLTNNIKLEELNASNNYLTELNLTNNIKLEQLDASNNSLTYIDLSNNLLLNILEISGSSGDKNNNKFETINLSNNTLLERLYMSGVSLQELDLSNNKNLIDVDISFNYLTKIELANNLNLETLNVRNNSLTDLDVSKNIKLKKISLSNYFYYTNDDTYNNSISSLNISNNILLEELDLAAIGLKTIDLSKNTNIKKLYLFDNNFNEIILSTSDNIDKFIKDIGKQKNNINYIGIGDNKKIEPVYTYYINDKIMISEEISVNEFINKLGLSNLQAKIYTSEYEEVKNGNVNDDYILKIYDNDIVIQELSISLIPSEVFKDENFYRCIIDAYNNENESNVEYSYKLSDEQLNKIMTVSCNKKNIEKVDGLEKLLSLQTLSLIENKIDEIDLSNNINLINLYLGSYSAKEMGGGNRIKNLDVSNNLKLKELSAGQNYLTQLDISNNKELELLILEYNDINNINVSNNTKLILLDLRYNNIDEIDITKNTELIELYVSNNKINNINVSNNTKLERLGLNKNNISDIDVSNNLNLKDFTIGGNKLSEINVSNNTKLEWLSIGSSHINFQGGGFGSSDDNQNNINNIDISNNSELKKLDVGGNNIKNIDLSKNENLRDLVLSYNELTQLNIQKNKKLNSLYISNNQLVEIDISENIELEWLYVNDNKLTTLDASNNTKLERLYLKNNPFGEEKKYIYKLDDIKVEDKVKIPENLNWDKPNWISNNENIAVVDQNGIVQTLNSGTVNIISQMNSNYSSANYNSTSPLVVVEITSDKYQINEEDNYIYVGLDEDIDTIKENIDVSHEEINININNNILQVKQNENILKKFKIINLNSTYYDLNKDYIYTELSQFDQTKINVTNGTTNIENNKLQIKYKDNVLQTYDLVSISSEVYDLSKEYIYTRTNQFDITKINVVNAEKEIKDNKLFIKYKDVVLQTYNLISISSEVYDLSKEYIYTGTNQFDILKINVVNAEKEVKDNKLLIKYQDDVLEEIKLISIDSKKYDLNKDYIYIGTGELNLNDISVINGTSEIKDDKLLVKYGEETLKQFNLVSVSIKSLKFIDDKGIYVSSRTEEQIRNDLNVINAESFVDKDKIEIIWNNIKLDTFKLYSINFGELKIFEKNITVSKNTSYKNFISNITITDGLTYKLLYQNVELTDGIIDKDMILKVYYDNKEIDTYNITNEYLNIDRSINVDSSNNYFSGFDLNTNVQSILNKIDTTGEVTIKNKDGKVLSSDDLLGTGSKITIKLSKDTYEYSIIVTGDVDGDGMLKLSDIMKIANYVYKNKNSLNGVYLKAADYDNNGNYNLQDIMKSANRLYKGGN